MVLGYMALQRPAFPEMDTPETPALPFGAWRDTHPAASFEDLLPQTDFAAHFEAAAAASASACLRHQVDLADLHYVKFDHHQLQPGSSVEVSAAVTAAVTAVVAYPVPASA